MRKGDSPQGTQNYFFMNPEQVPVKGMQSATSGMSLLQGYFKQLTNLRFAQTRTLVTRNGILGLNTAVPFNGLGSFRGCYSASMNGISSVWCAIGFGNTTNIYGIDENFNYIEITGIGTKYGNTRFQQPNNVNFNVIRDPSGLVQLLQIQNGVEQPRIWDQNQIAIHQPINVPIPNGFGVAPTFAGATDIVGFSATSSSPVGIISYANITSGSVGQVLVTTATNHGYITGENIVIVDVGLGVTGDQSMNGTWPIASVPQNNEFIINTGLGVATVHGQSPVYVTKGMGVSNYYNFPYNYGNPQQAIPASTISFTNNVINGDYTIVGLGKTLNLTISSNLVLAIYSFSNLNPNVSVGIGSTYTAPFTTIYDPSVSSYLSPAYQPSLNNSNPYTYAVSFPLSNLNTSDPNLNTKFLEFSWRGNSPAAPSYWFIGGVFDSFGVIGGAQYSLAYFNSASRAESPGYIPLVSQAVSNGTLYGAQFIGASMPNSSIFQFTNTISAINVSVPEIESGVDTLNIYRLDPNGTQFNYIMGYNINTFNSSGWSIGIANTSFNVTDNIPIIDEDPGRISPDSYSQIIPISNCSVYSGGRNICGGVGTSKSDVYMSEFYNNCRFASELRYLSPGVPDQSSATIASIVGEQIVSMVLGAAGFIGVSPIIIFTQSGAWQLVANNVQQLSRPSNVALNGGPYANATYEFLGLVYFIDVENELRVLSSSSSSAPLSKYVVDDKLQSADLTNATLGVINDRLYIGYSPSGETLNTNVLFLELTPSLLHQWGEDIPTGVDVAEFLPVTFGSKKLLYFFDHVGNMYSYEDPRANGDNGEPINIALETRHLNNQGVNRVYTENVGIVADPIGVGVTWYVNRILTGSEDNVTDGTFNMGSPVGNVIMQLESNPASSITEGIVPPEPGSLSLGVGIAITGISTSGAQIYTLYIMSSAMQDSGSNRGFN